MGLDMISGKQIIANRKNAKKTAGPNTLGKFRRYEAHIDRTLYKALHELQRLQAARLGHKVLAPLAIDVDVSKSDV